MGSSSRLVANAFMTMCDNFLHSALWLHLQDMISPSFLPHFIWFLCVSIAFGVYKSTQNDTRPAPPTRQKSIDPVIESHDLASREEHHLPPAEHEPVAVVGPFYDLAEAVSNTSCPIEEQQLEKSSGDIWEKFPVDSEETIPSSPLSSPSLSASWPPLLHRSVSDQTDISSQSPGPLVHVYCTHVEQKIGRNGLVSSITRPSYHVPAVHFPQLHTTFAASSERAFFNSQQEISASPIVRDPRCLDLQYRFSPSNHLQPTGEVSFDEIIATIRRNRKAGRDTSIYVHVVRVKDVVPSVVLNYVYYGQRHRSVVSATSQFGEDIPQSTKIVNFRAHFVRVKHISPETILWDCARHIAKSVKQDHGIILQTRDIAIEIYSQDQGRGGIQPSKIESVESIKAWIRDALPSLLQKNGNLVHLQVSAFKKT